MTIAPDRPTTVHELRLSDPEWADRSACRLSDPEDWELSTRTDPGTRPANQRARRICWQCPVRLDCLTAAAIEGDEYAIRGGMNPAERDGWLAEQGIRRPRRSTTGPVIAKSTKKPRPTPTGLRRPDLLPSVVGPLHEEGSSYNDLAVRFGVGRDTIRKRIRTYRALKAAGAL